MNREQKQEAFRAMCVAAFGQALDDKNEEALAALDRVADLDEQLASSFAKMRAFDAELKHLDLDCIGRSDAEYVEGGIAFARQPDSDIFASQEGASE